MHKSPPLSISLPVHRPKVREELRDGHPDVAAVERELRRLHLPSTTGNAANGPCDRTSLPSFVECYRPENRQDRLATWSEANSQGRWRSYTYEEPVARDKCSLDIFWLKDESLENGENLPEPAVIAAEIVEDLRAALEQFAEIQADLGKGEV